MNTRPAREHLRATRTCNKLLGVYTWPREPVMDLEGGVLARIDRNLLAALGQDATYRMVRVPATAVKWATWKRDCDSAGISMGRAIAALIGRELTGVFGDRSGDHLPVFAEQVEEELSRLQEQVDRREEKAVAVEELLRAWSEHLRRWEGELEVLERRVEFALKAAAQPRDAAAKVGRNERCPCGSGLKYKHCHGLSGRAQDGALR